MSLEGDSIATSFRSTYFLALHKSTTDPHNLRPIGIGTALRRLLCTISLHHLNDNFAAHLLPGGQLGINAHTRWYRHHPPPQPSYARNLHLPTPPSQPPTLPCYAPPRYQKHVQLHLTRNRPPHPCYPPQSHLLMPHTPLRPSLR